MFFLSAMRQVQMGHTLESEVYGDAGKQVQV